MKRRDLPRKLQLLAAVAMGSFPVAPMLFLKFCPEFLPWAPAYALGFFLFSALGLLVRGKWRLLYGAAAVALSAVVCLLCKPGDGLAPVLGVWALYAILLLWSLQLGGWDREDEMRPILTVGLLIIQLLGQLVLYSDSLKPEPVLAGYGPVLRGSFLVFLLLAALSMNRDGMNSASWENRRVTQAMRRKNTLMTLGLFALALGASFIPYVYELLRSLVRWLVALVVRLLTALFSQQQTGSPSGGGEMSTGVPAVEETEPSLLVRILEIVLAVAACLAVLCLLGYLFYRLGLVLKRLLKKLWGLLERYGAAVSEDYVDEITSTRESGEDAGSRVRQGRGRPGRWRGGAPEAHVRYRYLRLLWKHPEWSRGTTAREKLPGTLAEVYERARYSTHPITEAEAERFRAEIKDV